MDLNSSLNYIEHALKFLQWFFHLIKNYIMYEGQSTLEQEGMSLRGIQNKLFWVFSIFLTEKFTFAHEVVGK